MYMARDEGVEKKKKKRHEIEVEDNSAYCLQVLFGEELLENHELG